MADASNRTFHFLREIASGSFGRVFLAEVKHDDGFSRLVAVKLLHPQWSSNREVASRMRDEARLLGHLRHRHIVDVFDLTRIDGRTAVVMEYLDAVDLKVLIRHLKLEGKVLPVTVALDVGMAIASALDAAYNRPPQRGERPLRVIHRDIKPSNVMLDGTGTVKVLDFGGARADFEARESETKELAFGSIEYMAPERVFFEPENGSSDVYSLGATLYELLALERVGKARVRAGEHGAYLEARLDQLGTGWVGMTHAWPEVRAMLREFMAFERDERPDSAQALAAMRALRKQLRGVRLDEWAEEVVPPILEDIRENGTGGDQDPLLNRVITEDRLILPDMVTYEVLVEPITDNDDLLPVGLGTEDLSIDTLIGHLSPDEEPTVALAMPSPTLIPALPEPEPPPAPAPPAPPPRSTRWAVPAAIALGLTVVAIGIALPRSAAPVVAPAPEPAPVVAAPVIPESALAHFVNAGGPAVSGLTVRCHGASGSHPETVAVAVGEGLVERCIVSGVRAQDGRGKLQVVLTEVRPGSYTCFAAGEESCE